MKTRFVANNNGRADSILAEELDVSRGYTQKLIKNKGLKIQGKTAAKPSVTVLEGDILVISKNVVAKLEHVKEVYSRLTPEKIDFKIVYEDNDVLVVDKPSGLVVHPAHACPSGTLLNGVLYYLQPEESKEEVELPKPVNRIDKDTSGLVVIAKNESAHLILSKQFEDRKVEKWYQAIVFGDFTKAEAPHAPVVEENGIKYSKEGKSVEYGTWLNRSRMDRRRVVVADSGRWALSRFIPVSVHKADVETKPVKWEKNFPKAPRQEPKTWLKVQILTGRTHQIRAQLKSLGFGLIGDPMYTSKRHIVLSNSLFEKIGEPTRLLLHSWKLTLRLPSGALQTFEAEVPKVFNRVYEA